MKPDATRALASALPADLSHSPLLGILVVIVGAGIATLAARFLSLGLADLRGHLSIGADEGAWIGTAFNAATMFIGPLTVYLGALLGTRPVLLVCSGVFAIVSACLPFAHSYSVLILLMAIAGLSSGTFYPLTLSFALMNIPLRYLALTLGLYATCIEGAVNFAPSCASIGIIIMGMDVLDVRAHYAADGGMRLYGIPGLRGRSRQDLASFAGFLCASRPRAPVRGARPGTAARLVALRRVLALFDGALPLLRGASSSEPANPLVDLPFLRKWNTRLGFRYLRLPFLPAGDCPGHPAGLAVPGSTPLKSVNSVVDGLPGVSRVLRGPPVEQGFRLTAADGRICGHGTCAS
jgi:MFS family permease